MKGLNNQQRKYLADFSSKLALLLAAGFIIGQVVPGEKRVLRKAYNNIFVRTELHQCAVGMKLFPGA